MNVSERRIYPRYSPKALTASIRLGEEPDLRYLEGDVMDISFTGIKIRLKTPSAWNMAGKIRIDMTLPETGIPMRISGILRHQTTSGDVGIEYVDAANVIDMDKFIFECIKRTFGPDANA
jgi:PilZ domain